MVKLVQMEQNYAVSLPIPTVALGRWRNGPILTSRGLTKYDRCGTPATERATGQLVTRSEKIFMFF